MQKTIVVIYVNPDAESTKLLDKYLAKNIDELNKYIVIKKIKVNKENSELIKKKGITRTPTLVFNGKQFVSLEKIINFLKLPSQSKDSYGTGNISSDDLVLQYQNDAIQPKENEEEEQDDMNPETRGEELRQKMMALQKRRPAQAETSKPKDMRKSKSTSNSKINFETDEDFRKASGTDNILETPTKKYMDDMDGELLIEEYYLDEAIKSGKKPSTRARRKPI